MSTQQVAEFITDLRYHDLPGQVKEVIHLALLDTLGAMLAGTLAPITDISVKAATKLWPGQDATIVLSGQCASMAGAAFANANAANAIDIDDCAEYTKGHPGAQVLPAALAVAEANSLSGEEMLTAMVVGYEVAHRAGRIWHDSKDVYQACGSWGSMACAAIASKLLKYRPEQTWHALGIADYHAPNLPMMRDIDHPAMVKHGIGWGALNGIVSAELAALGYTAIPSIFDLEQYQDWVTDVGSNYIMADGISWKEFAACAWTHAGLKAIEKLKAEHDFNPVDITHARLETFHEAVRLGAKLPETTEQAQFNTAWPLAVYLLDDIIGPDQMLEKRLADPQVRELASKFELVETDELNEWYQKQERGLLGGRFASVLILELADGRTLHSGYVDSSTNFPQNIFTPETLEDKFRWLAGFVIDDHRIDTLVEMIQHFEDVDDVHELTRLIG